MFWTTGLLLVALTFGQLLAGLVKPGVPGVSEDTITAFMQPGSVNGLLTEVTGLNFEKFHEEDELTEATQPPTAEAHVLPNIETLKPPTSEATEPDSEDNDENSNESDSSESNEDPLSGSVSELVNKLKVKGSNSSESNADPASGSVSEIVNKPKVKESDSSESNADPLSGSVSELVNKPVVKIKVKVNNIVNDKQI